MVFYISKTKTFAVGTQKNRLNETALLSTQNICLNWLIRKITFFFTLREFALYLGLWVYHSQTKSEYCADFDNLFG